MKKASLFLASLILFIDISWSQNQVTDRKDILTNHVSATNNPASSSGLPFFSSATEAETIVKAIMDAVGLEADFRIKPADVPNVEATIRHHQRYILYNPDFIDKVNKATNDRWASVFILAHEIGHHLNGHTLVRSDNRNGAELEADQFAGFVLHRLGATLQQAQLALYYIADTEASKTHPARSDRLLAIEKGWDKANEKLTMNN